jgi:hypothetical protein
MFPGPFYSYRNVARAYNFSSREMIYPLSVIRYPLDLFCWHAIKLIPSRMNVTRYCAASTVFRVKFIPLYNDNDPPCYVRSLNHS